MLKVFLEKGERGEMENMKEESEIEEEEEVLVDVNYMNFGLSTMILIAMGVKKSVVSREWIEGYLKYMKVDESEIKKEELL